jgi:hypothetical protein
MGINARQFDFIMNNLNLIFNNFNGKCMLELGNQHLKSLLLEKLKIKDKIAKHYFESMGFCHTSIDLSGKDGALKLDLGKPIIDEFFINKFDIITNSGTSEHVEPYESQYECFKNIHNFCKVGGVMIHLVPEKDSFIKHCNTYYTVDFFNTLVIKNNYNIIELKRLDDGFKKFKDKKRCLIAACFIKKENTNFNYNKDNFFEYLKKIKNKKNMRKYKI